MHSIVETVNNQSFGPAGNEPLVLCMVGKCSVTQSFHSFKFDSGSC